MTVGAFVIPVLASLAGKLALKLAGAVLKSMSAAGAAAAGPESFAALLDRRPAAAVAPVATDWSAGAARSRADLRPLETREGLPGAGVVPVAGSRRLLAAYDEMQAP